MYQLYINGKCVEGKGEAIDVTCPATGKVLATIHAATEEQADEALQAAQVAFTPWSRLSLNERIGWMKKLKAACQKKKEELVALLAAEGGKSIKEAGNDFNAFLNYFNFYAEQAKQISGEEIPDYNGHKDALHLVIKRPIGVVVGHLAWNMPASNVGLKMCPSMASGCTCVLKPSVETPLTTMRIGALCEEIGLPAGAVNFVVGRASRIGNHLSASTIPAMVSLIGSTAVGLEVMQKAATSIKHFSMELGGNAPCIVMPDADIVKAAKFVANRKTRISGQGCANINRIFVHKSIHDEFLAKLVEFVSKIQVGWGEDVPDAMGPMINCKARDHMLDLVKDTVSHGAKLCYGGTVPDLGPEFADGAFFVPAVLDGVTDDMPIANQEIFGPIYSVMIFSDADEVIRRANQTPLGLSGYLLTNDFRMIGRCLEELGVGELQINYPNFAAPNLPHIGIKQSGLGCDRGKWSLEEYYHIRRVSAQLG